MSYSNATRFFQIPVMGMGDLLSEEQEMIQMGILDSLLYALSYGSRCLLVEEGNYSISESKLNIAPVSSGGYSLLGIVNGRMFGSNETIVVDRTLYSGNVYYAYVEYSSGLNSDIGEFTVSIYDDERPESELRLPLCVIDGTDGWAIDIDVAGKNRASSITTHIADSTNPHGVLLTQNELQIVDKAAVKSARVSGSIYGTYTTEGATPVTVQVSTSGSVAFATCYPEDASAGTIAWTISGNSISFTNSGATGVTVHYKADVL